jgi:hypothetical protein
MKSILAFLFAIATVPVLGQSIPLERILLPITVRNAPGAYGSTWNTSLWIRIDTQASYVFIHPLSPAVDRDPPYGDIFGPVLAPFSYPISFYRTQPGETAGSLMYVGREQSDDVHLSLRLSNGTVASNPVELPVVRERSFTTSTLHILGIPLGSSGRAMLRVYGIDPHKLGSVHVRAFLEDRADYPNTLLLDSVVPLTVTQKFSPTSVFDQLPVRPPVAEVSLSALIPDSFKQLRLEISPVDPTLRLWGFVSITDNVRQDVVLRTPN